MAGGLDSQQRLKGAANTLGSLLEVLRSVHSAARGVVLGGFTVLYPPRPTASIWCPEACPERLERSCIWSAARV